MKTKLFFLLMMGPFVLLAQQSFDSEIIDIGNMGLRVTNVGTLGRPDVRNDPQGDPSMEYPINSGVEHLFEAGIWIGAQVEGQIAVSTSTQDASSGYSTGNAGFEFTAEVGNSIQQRSSLANSEFFIFDAISHQDMIVEFSDRNVLVPGTTIVIEDHDFPLEADVNLECYAWNFSFADFFVIMNYEITNNSDNIWDSVYVGIWSDMVVRNVNVSTDFGSAFFSSGGYGYIDSLYTNYAFDNSGDPGFTESYGAVQFLGLEWRDLFFHPDNTDMILAMGYPEPKINSNFWIFNSTGSPPYNAPSNDVESYGKLKKGLNYDNISIVDFLVDPSTTGGMTNLVSAGPLVEVLPGESFNMVYAMVCARQFAPSGTSGADKDTPEARAELIEHLGWAKRTFNGEDLNSNGMLDPGEDLDDDGELDRYILPEPPATPKVKIVPTSNQVEIYWDEKAESSIDPISKRMDFEGYRLYRTKVGDDFSLNLIGDANLIAQWDKAGNAVGFNNGFEAVRLTNPVFFEEDTTAYYYKYVLDNLLNGWQYMIILTAFDEGDDNLRIEPLESSFVENAFRLWAGTETADFNSDIEVGVYPNPYRVSAAWDGTTSQSKKLIFYNLPARCEIKVYTIGGDIIAEFLHNSASYSGNDSQWFDIYGGDESKRIFSGGEHAWDILSNSKQSITQGLYLFSVRDLETDEVKTGKFAVIQ